MSNDKLLNVSKAYMLHCSIDGWGVLMERREEPDRRYLASIWIFLFWQTIVIIIKRSRSGCIITAWLTFKRPKILCILKLVQTGLPVYNTCQSAGSSKVEIRCRLKI